MVGLFIDGDELVEYEVVSCMVDRRLATDPTPHPHADHESLLV